MLLGDFNDGPDSRTLRLFGTLAKEATKPKADRFTFSSTKPESEIDFIFTSPADRWTAKGTRVVTEPVASDHRPVFTQLTLRHAVNRQN